MVAAGACTLRHPAQPALSSADSIASIRSGVSGCSGRNARGSCSRARNLYSKLPERERERERERVKHACWQALDDAINPGDAKQRMQALIDQLDKDGYTAAARCLSDDLDALVVHLRYHPDTAADGAARTFSSDRSARSNAAPK